ncbi:MAG: trypsin-like peptidase domain-containing protein [Anaerolineae bacterium]
MERERMNDRRRRLLLIAAVVMAASTLSCTALTGLFPVEQEAEPPAVSEVTREVRELAPTLTPEPGGAPAEEEMPNMEHGALAALYDRVNRGVVSIRVYVDQGGMTGQGAGSGFVLDEEGHIVTNNHVVAEANVITVIFHKGFEVRAETVGTDADSDLAVIRVEDMPDDVLSLPLAPAGAVEPGDWVVAIGNPFSLGGSMSLGIVSAVGRAIPSGATPFRIPRAIQTDAAINPGNSGGPLLNLEGEVVGVNAQIATGGTGVSAGVGFAIPSDVLRRVAPALIEEGAYPWPWLGVSGLPVNLLIQEANDLSAQRGAYIVELVQGGPAAEAGLQGATGVETVLGTEVPVGGDVVVEADDEPIEDFTDLLAHVAFQQPGDVVELTILRGGEREQVTVELAVRPENLRQ